MPVSNASPAIALPEAQQNLSLPEILGTAGDDVLIGTTGDDVITGGYGLDTITGADGDDTISGGPNGSETAPPLAPILGFGSRGEVIVVPGQPAEVLDGGAGSDSAVVSGPLSSYTLLLGGDGLILVDRRPDGDGIDQLSGFEFIDFGDDGGVFGTAPMNLDLFGRQGGVGEDDLEKIIELYIAYFDRAPDAIGLSFWADAFSKGTTLEQMAHLFMQQDETIAAFPPEMSNVQLVSTVYQNVLGRVPDTEGGDFWTGLLDAGIIERDQFILEVIAGAQADPFDGATGGFIDQQQADRNYLSNKVDIGAYFAVHRGLSDAGDAAAVMDIFDGSPISIFNAGTAVDGFYEAALDPVDGSFIMPLVGVLDNPFDLGS